MQALFALVDPRAGGAAPRSGADLGGQDLHADISGKRPRGWPLRPGPSALQRAQDGLRCSRNRRVCAAAGPGRSVAVQLTATLVTRPRVLARCRASFIRDRGTRIT